MTEKRRFLDVWILESNTVYREVPYTVVADWIQQGRLLEDDMQKPSGTADWVRIGGTPELAPYLPRSEPYRVDDQAEALEPVELDFRWKKRHDEDDSDVDMIPLIDVSLVLLIFFMLTASGAGMAAFVPTPAAEYGILANNAEAVQLNIDLEGPDNNRVPVYSLSVGSKPPVEGDSNLQTRDQLLGRLSAYLDKNSGRVEVTINAHPEVKSGVVRDLMGALESEPFRGRIVQKYIGVSEK